MEIKESVIEWLLEKENPSVRYRTLTELLDKPDNDREVLLAKEEIWGSPVVQNIVSRSNEKGQWIKDGLGEGAEYKSHYTTHFNLYFLSELGLDKSSEFVDKAVNNYLKNQKSNGDFYRNFSCLYAYNLVTLIRFGYQKDPRVQKTIEHLLNSNRMDGGYLCDLHEGKYKTKSPKSCIRGSTKAI